MEGYILRCPTGIHTRSFILQYTFMWPILFFGRLRHCILCGWYYNLYGKWKNKSVISALETSSWLLFWWFNNNFMKANGDKSHLIMSCKETAATAILMVCPLIPAKQVLLGITIDHELKFDDYVYYLCKNQVDDHVKYLMNLPVLHLLSLLEKNELP